MDVRDYNDIKALLEPLVAPLESIAGALVEGNANLESIVANGVDINVTIHIGGRPEQ